MHRRFADLLVMGEFSFGRSGQGASFKVLCISPFSFSILASSFGVGCPFRFAIALFCVRIANCCFKERLFCFFIGDLHRKMYNRIETKPTLARF